MSNKPRQNSKRRVLFGGLLLILSLACATAAGAEGESFANACNSSVEVDNYLAPLEPLPKLRGFSSSGRLGFGPGNLRVYPPRNQLIVAGLDRIESSGSLSHRSNSTQELEWVVESRLERLDHQGSIANQVKTKQQRIGAVAGFAHRQFGFGSRVAPGIYRLRVSFSKGKASLGTFSEYFRVVRPRSSLNLRAPGSEAQPGSIVKLRVENLGTVSATYTFYPRLFSPDGSEVPIDYGVGASLKPLLAAGFLSPCIELPLPPSLPAGSYSITLAAKDRTMKHADLLSATLHIAGS